MRPKARSTTAVTSSLIPKVKKFKADISKLKKDVSKIKRKEKSPTTLSSTASLNKELARLEKEHKQLLMRYKKKERGGKEEGYITSGAGDDLDFIIKMFQK